MRYKEKMVDGQIEFSMRGAGNKKGVPNEKKETNGAKSKFK